jgi:pimeloyl-ACP methyl ester carboxylesterase
MSPAKTLRATVLAASGAALALVLAACGSSGGGSATTPTPTPTGPKAIAAPECFPDGSRGFVEGNPDEASAAPVAVGGTGTHGIVFAPQDGGDWCQWSFAYQHFLDKGYAIASFTYPQQPRDVVAGAVDALKRAGVQDVALVGASKGGSFVGAYAASVGAKAFVAFSPPALVTGADAAEGAQDFQGPLLVVASKDDNAGVASTSSRQVSHASSDPSTFLEVPGTAHGIAILQGGHSDAVWAAMDATIAKGFGS